MTPKTPTPPTTPAHEVIIEFRRVGKRFGDNIVLDGVDLTVREREICFIIGKSGAGKSVLVKHLVGLLRPDTGQIVYRGEDITHKSERDFYPHRHRCTYVFQHSTLFDSMTLQENVALPLRKHRGLTHRDSLDAAMAYLARVQMESLAARRPADVGDGLRKRVAIARALTLDPEVIVFDEPTTGLDPISAVNVDRLIRTLSDEVGVTSLVVSHDLRSIFTVADRIVMLYQGRIRLDGTPAAYRATDDPIVRQFVDGEPEGPMEL